MQTLPRWLPPATDSRVPHVLPLPAAAAEDRWFGARADGDGITSPSPLRDRELAAAMFSTGCSPSRHRTSGLLHRVYDMAGLERLAGNQIVAQGPPSEHKARAGSVGGVRRYQVLPSGCLLSMLLEGMHHPMRSTPDDRACPPRRPRRNSLVSLHDSLRQVGLPARRGSARPQGVDRASARRTCSNLRASCQSSAIQRVTA